MDKKTPLSDLMSATMDKVNAMVDTNSIVGQPITTADGVTLIPISKVSFGVGGGAGAGVKIEPVAFLIIKDGVTRMMPVATSPKTTMDRIVDMAPEMMDKVEKIIAKKGEKETV